MVTFGGYHAEVASFACFPTHHLASWLFGLRKQRKQQEKGQKILISGDCFGQAERAAR